MKRLSNDDVRWPHADLQQEVLHRDVTARNLALPSLRTRTGAQNFDIDFFKKKNDTFGHLAGDSILRELAQVVRSKLRREDVFARVGGEEFAVITPEVGIKVRPRSPRRFAQWSRQPRFSSRSTSSPPR